MDIEKDNQESIENELRLLRKSRDQLKQRIHELNSKEAFEEKRSLKRSREVDADDVMHNKKLKSVVVVEGAEETKEPVVEQVVERKPTVVETAQDKARNRRLLGSLLVGTLNRIQKDVSREQKDEVLQQRQEVVKTIDEKVDSIWIKEKEKITAQRTECQEKLDETYLQIQEKQKELQEIKEKHYYSLLAGFAKTMSKPEIYFLPAKVDEFTEKVFGIGPPVETSLKIEVDMN